MNRTTLLRYSVAVSFLLGVLSVWPAPAAAQTVVGGASAVNATVLGATNLLGTTLPGTITTLADTGTLSAINAARDASIDTGSVLSLLNAEVLSAGTISWPDQVDSVASLGSLNLTVAGIGIYADSVIARASQALGAAGSGITTIDNLSINGIPIAVTGAPNQTVAIPGGQVIINEQTISSTGTAVVNALHVTVSGVADVVIASATAGIS